MMKFTTLATIALLAVTVQALPTYPDEGVDAIVPEMDLEEVPPPMPSTEKSVIVAEKKNPAEKPAAKPPAKKTAKPPAKKATKPPAKKATKPAAKPGGKGGSGASPDGSKKAKAFALVEKAGTPVSAKEKFCNQPGNAHAPGCFKFTVSMVYLPSSMGGDDHCGTLAPVESGYRMAEDVTLIKPIGVCTKNVVGSTVRFTCDEDKGVIVEHVHHDVLDGSSCEDGATGACTCQNHVTEQHQPTASDRTMLMPIANGCSHHFFGDMKMTWDKWCMKK
jgi:hypothetical protein